MPETIALTPTGDFADRDALPRTDIPKDQWSSCGRWGPCTLPYPQVVFPDGIDIIKWSQERVLEVAKKFIGVRYAHYHFPEMGGIDCSNFTALVYNYAFGTRFTSNVERQAHEAGRRLDFSEALQPGDLIFTWSKDGARISHVIMYISEDFIIDSTGPGVQIRPFKGWYKNRYAWARRLIE